MSDTLKLRMVKKSGAHAQVRIDVLQPTETPATRAFALAVLQELHPQDLGVDWRWASAPAACYRAALEGIAAVRVVDMALAVKRPPRAAFIELDIELTASGAAWLAGIPAGTERLVALFPQPVKREVWRLDGDAPAAKDCLTALRGKERADASNDEERSLLARWIMHPKDAVVERVLALTEGLEAPGFMQPLVTELTQDLSPVLRTRAIEWLAAAGNEEAGHVLTALLAQSTVLLTVLIAMGGLAAAPKTMDKQLAQVVPTLDKRLMATGRWALWRRTRTPGDLDAWLRSALAEADGWTLTHAPARDLDEVIAAVAGWLSAHPEVVKQHRKGKDSLMYWAKARSRLGPIKKAIEGGGVDAPAAAVAKPAAAKAAAKPKAAKA